MKLFGKKKPKEAEAAAAGGAGRNGATTPGANSIPGGSTVFRVTIPDNVQPGEEFQVYAGSRIVRVKCPPDARAGQALQITVPGEPAGPPGSGGGAPGGPPGNGGRAPPPTPPTGGGGPPPDSPNVLRIPDSNPPAYMVTIPFGIGTGQQFPVWIQGQQLMVTCPPNAGPGKSVRIIPPPPPTELTRGPSQDSAMGGSASSHRNRPKDRESTTQLFEVAVPKGVQPGAPFALLAGGVRVLVTCPPNAGPGQKIRFKLPLELTQRPKMEDTSAMNQIKLKYDKDGWTRTVRATDLKFQWVRMDDKGDIDLSRRFDMDKSAYVRRLEFRPGNDPRIRTGVLSLVPATESVADSKIKAADGRDLVTYSDLAQAQVKKLDDKTQWFQDTCAQLCVEYMEGHMRMNVRRAFLLGDSVDAVMSLSRKDLRKLWRFEFIGEMGIDAGGLAREWFELVCKEIFDPDMGLWMSSATNQMSMTINPASGTCLQR